MFRKTKHKVTTVAITLSGILLNINVAFGAKNIKDYIYNLQNNWCNTNNSASTCGDTTYYSKDMGTTWTSWAWGQSFTQHYGSNTLIIGNDSKTANSSSTHWFGRLGDVGYINAYFKAGEIYLTGTIGSGNAWRTGGGATLDFESSGKLTVDGAHIWIYRAGTQNPATNLKGKTIEVKNSTLEIENINSSNSGYGINIGTGTTENLTITNTAIKMSGGRITVTAKKSTLAFGDINATGGTLDLSNANYSSLTTGAINVTDFNIFSDTLRFGGDIINGKLISGGDFNADKVVIKASDNTLNAANINIKDLQLSADTTLGFGNNVPRKFTINSTADVITIGSLSNPQSNVGQGFTATLNVNQKLKVDSITFNSQTAGLNSSTFNITAENNSMKKDIEIGTVGFNADNVTGVSQGYLNIYGNDITIDTASGRTQNFMNIYADGDINVKNVNFVEDICITDSCGGIVRLQATNGSIIVQNIRGGNDSEQGIRAGNSVIASGKNFYGGFIQAIGY